jgi:hypothetical protein
MKGAKGMRSALDETGWPKSPEEVSAVDVRLNSLDNLLEIIIACSHN